MKLRLKLKLRSWRVVQYLRIVHAAGHPEERTEHVMLALPRRYTRRTTAERFVKLQNEHDYHAGQTLHIKRNELRYGAWRIMEHARVERERASKLVKIQTGREWWR